MKICSKEALILGGVYMVLATPFSLLGFSVISDILFIVFVIFFVIYSPFLCIYPFISSIFEVFYCIQFLSRRIPY